MQLKTPSLYVSIPGHNYAYLYIRKNACSNFKTMIVHTSDFAKQSSDNALTFMNRYHRLPETKHLRHRRIFCVVRDPLTRIHSAFLNRVIQRRDHHLYSAIKNASGREVDALTAGDIFEWVLADDRLDLHFLPQFRHMTGVPHELWPIERLRDCAAFAWGDEIANTYFGHHHNSGTRQIAKVSGKYQGLRVSDLSHMERTGEFPDLASLVTAEMYKRLQRMYAEDFSLHHAALGHSTLSPHLSALGKLST